ncbi:acyl-CoA-binding protein [Belliella aquatica]|uniref:Acyl-CoA-binding protein n=1 Tax=Belliella aquatica TaxID=1323734 RepID=A0ABQ1MEL4_9BACT|nr:acyl-CoA-binding protein [Belliella aquatica]MCH7405165.1 acyl-CoA-binding protein [Belliella aquatica]GGC39224.1 acyl-CoA-binding protein [Belliella aquatica]
MNANTLDEAMALTKKFTTKPSNEELLKLYGLYKQATEGDNKGETPGGFDFVAAAKHNAWLNNIGKSKEEAQQQYISFVNSISTKYI